MICILNRMFNCRLISGEFNVLFIYLIFFFINVIALIKNLGCNVFENFVVGSQVCNLSSSLD